MKAILIIGVALTLSGCFSNKGGYYKDDGPPKWVNNKKVSRVADAVPKQEPLSKRGNSPYVVAGKRYVPMKSAQGYYATGTASWYGKKFHGRTTSSGEKYDMYAMTAAHTVLPLPSYVRVTNLDNGHNVIVKVNDRGPFLHNRLIDVSYAAAVKLDMLGQGTARVSVEAITAQNNNHYSSRTISSHVIQSPVQDIQRTPLVEQAPRQFVGSDRFVQIGAFSEYQNALSLRDKLLANGFDKVLIKQPESNGSAFFKVQVGPLLEQSVDAILQRLRQAGFSGNLLKP